MLSPDSPSSPRRSNLSQVTNDSFRWFQKEKATTHPFLLRFMDRTLEEKFSLKHAKTMFRRRFIFIVLICASALVTGFSIGKYEIIHEPGTVQSTIANMFSVVVYTISRVALAVLVCANPAKNWDRYNISRWVNLISVSLVHIWMVCILLPTAELSQGVKLPVVQAFNNLGEMLFCGMQFVQILPLLVIHAVDLLLWEYRCGTPLNSFMVLFVYALMSFLLWDRESTIRENWSSSVHREQAVLETQRNAAHDIRNDLQEVLGLVELSTEKSMVRSKHYINDEIEGKAKDSADTNNGTVSGTRVIQGEATSKNESAGVEQVCKLVVASGDSIDTMPLSKTFEPASSAYPGKYNRSLSEDAPSFAKASSLSQGISMQHFQLEKPNAQPEEGKDGTLGVDEVKSRVRRAATRIRTRLDAGLRDTATAIKRKDLLPVIQMCNLTELIRVEVFGDPQIEFFISPGFPDLVETDPAWVRSCVANLVGNAKKHGPKNGPIQVRLLWEEQDSAVRIEVSDRGQGVTEAQALALFRDIGDAPVLRSDSSGIGLQAVKTYIAGLGGTVGADKSTFWFRIPLLRRPTEMHPIFLYFNGAEEANFRKYIIPKASIFSISYGLLCFATYFLLALIFQENDNKYFCYYRNTKILAANIGGEFNDRNCSISNSIASNILISSEQGVTGFDILFWMLPSLSVGCALAWRLHRPTSPCAYKCAIVWTHIAFSTTDFLFIQNLLMAMAVSPLQTNPLDLMNSVMILLRQFVLTPVGGFPILHTHLLFILPIVSRITVVFLAPTIWLQIAYFLQALIGFAVLLACWYLEKRIRISYKNHFRHKELKNNQQTLDHLAKVLSLEARQKAQSNAAHEVSGCFNTLLVAALEMQKYVEMQSASKNLNTSASPNFLLSGTSEDQVKWQHIFGMITEAQDDFSFLQNTQLKGHPHELHRFHVQTMLENAVRIFKYGARNGMVIKVNPQQDGQIVFESSVPHLRQILHQLMHILGDSDYLEIDGCILNDTRFNDRVLRIGLSVSFNLDLKRVQQARPDLMTFHVWNNDSSSVGQKTVSSLPCELVDVIRCVSLLKGILDSKWVCRNGMTASGVDLTVFTVHAFIPRGGDWLCRENQNNSNMRMDSKVAGVAIQNARASSSLGRGRSYLPRNNVIQNFVNDSDSRNLKNISDRMNSQYPENDASYTLKSKEGSWDGKRSLLLVDDDKFVLDVCEMQLSTCLHEQGYADVSLETCDENVLNHLMHHKDYDLVLMDISFPGTPDVARAGESNLPEPTPI